MGDCLWIDKDRHWADYNIPLAWSAAPIVSTAAQRAEAFLRTIGKWDDSK
jgi:hypothetical protein